MNTLLPLREEADHVEAFLLSAAGNDVIGDINGQPQIKRLLKQRTGNEPARDLIDRSALDDTLALLKRYYRKIIDSVRGVAGLETLPIIIHGYDFPFPGSKRDARNPIWAAPDQWLGRPLNELNIRQANIQRAVIKILLNELYGMLEELSDADPHVHVVDLRGALPKRSDWADEIHGTDEGFEVVAEHFVGVIEDARNARFSQAIDGGLESSSADSPRLETQASDPKVIVIDPGHGGRSAVGGSSANNATGPAGTLEKNLTLDVGLRTGRLLRKRGHLVTMTRETDVNIGLRDRAKVAKDRKADTFLSIHFNGFRNPNTQGTETYHHQTLTLQSAALAESIQTRLIAATRLRDRGVKQARFGVINPDNHAAHTAACLAEISFLTDPAEEMRLQNTTYLDRIAQALADGIEDYLRETAGMRSGGPAFESTSETNDLGDSIDLHDDLAGDTEGPALFRDPGSYRRSDVTTLSISGIPQHEKFLRAWRQHRQESAGLGLHFEATVGKDDSLPVEFLAKGHEQSEAVCKIVTSGVNYRGRRSGPWSGTGFLVAPDLLLTNNHVLNSREVARRARVRFDYRTGEDGLPTEGVVYNLDPDALFITSPAEGGLDYTFVRIVGAPQNRFGHIAMQRAVFSAEPLERANVVHHPAGDPKRVSLQDNQVLEFDTALLHYASDTMGGSSGSPVFDNTWRLIALHHASRTLPAGQVSPDGSGARVINEGIKISAIAIDLDSRISNDDESSAARIVLDSISGSDSVTGFFGASGRGSGSARGLESVVDAYRGSSKDIDVGFWNLLWFNKHYRDRQAKVARVIADLNLDIWAFSETSPQATESLVAYLENEFGQRFEWAASEPNASPGKQTTTVIWNPLTVNGRRLHWPKEVEPLLRADSRNVPNLGFEAVEGKVFNRYPGLFRFDAVNRDDGIQDAFGFNLVPLHLKAKGEGAKRRRLASQILTAVVQRMIEKHDSGADWLIGGDVNAEVATGQFKSLTNAGFLPMGAEDEESGAISYIKGTNLSDRQYFPVAEYGSTLWR